MSYGTEFAESIAGYLTQNNMKSLGCLNRKVLGELADDFQTKHEARRATRKRAQTEAEWLSELESEPANQNLVHGFQAEVQKARLWLKKHPLRRFTRIYLINWLLQADRTVGPNGGDVNKKQVAGPDYRYTEPPDWRIHAHKIHESLVEMEWLDIDLHYRCAILKFL